MYRCVLVAFLLINLIEIVPSLKRSAVSLAGSTASDWRQKSRRTFGSLAAEISQVRETMSFEAVDWRLKATKKENASAMKRCV